MIGDMVGGMLNRFWKYSAGGVANMAGMEPATATLATNGQEFWRYGFGNTALSRSPLKFGTADQFGMAYEKFGFNMGTGSTLLMGGSTLFQIGSGFATNGFVGAYEAGIKEVASSAAHMRFGNRRSMGKDGVLNINEPRPWMGSKMNFAANLARTVGAGIGGQIGSSLGYGLAGTPGAFVGAYVGAAMGTPGGLMSMGAVGAGMGLLAMPALAPMATAYAGYKVAKFGADHTARRRRIDTSGDTSAFMTGNAMTMRARAVQAIGKSHLNARSALGQEANFMHTNKNYFSRYRQV